MTKKLLLLLLLLPLVSPHASSASSTTKPPHDIAGKPLRRGRKYYILPVFRGRGGGLTLAQRNATTCPLYVGQELSEVSSGLPLTFSPVDPNDKLVRLSTDLNIQFSAATVCTQSTVWRLDIDAGTGRRYVSSGGVKGCPGLATVSNWFKIERTGDGEDDYKLVFCPGVCKFCKVLCRNIGVFVEGGRRLLGMSDAPFPVMFKRAL